MQPQFGAEFGAVGKMCHVLDLRHFAYFLEQYLQEKAYRLLYLGQQLTLRAWVSIKNTTFPSAIDTQI